MQEEGGEDFRDRNSETDRYSVLSYLQQSVYNSSIMTKNPNSIDD